MVAERLQKTVRLRNEPLMLHSDHRAHAQEIAHEMGHYVVSRVLGFETGT